MDPPPSSAFYFRIGDRVQLIFPQAGITVGTLGTVVSRFLGGSLYDVRFDGQSGLYVVSERKLAPAPPEPSRHQ